MLTHQYDTKMRSDSHSYNDYKCWVLPAYTRVARLCLYQENGWIVFMNFHGCRRNNFHFLKIVGVVIFLVVIRDRKRYLVLIVVLPILRSSNAMVTTSPWSNQFGHSVTKGCHSYEYLPCLSTNPVYITTYTSTPPYLLCLIDFINTN